MMGQHARSEALFYYFRLEDQVPENHLLRLIEKHISFAFVREKLKDSYGETGRPSIDPEFLVRILLIGYLYGITRERKLVEELRMHLVWRWFTGLGFDQEIPHHSTFSGTEGSRSRSCLSNCLRRSWRAAWRLDWFKETTCWSMAASSRVRRLPSLSSNSLTRSECGQSRQTRITPFGSLLIVYMTPSIAAVFSAGCDRNHFPVTFV